MEELLSSWGLDEATIQLFVDEKMDLLTVRHMDDDSVRLLIPSEGMRIRFRIHHSKWVKGLDAEDENSEFITMTSTNAVQGQGSRFTSTAIGATAAGASDGILTSDGSAASKSIQVLAVTDINGNVNSFPYCFMEGDDEKPNEDEAGGKTVEVLDVEEVGSDDDFLKSSDEMKELTASSKSKETIDFQENISQEPLKEKQSQADPPKDKERLRDSTSSYQNLPKKMKTYDLESILNSTSAGKRVLSLYRQDDKFVKDSYRDSLVECVLEEETREDLGKIISHERLKFLAERIVELFPEDSIKFYYEVTRNPKTDKVITKGKLVWRYYNRRRDFAKCGAISKGVKSKCPDTSDKSRKSIEVDKSTAGSLCWLETNRGNKGNWQEVLRHWRATSSVRMDKLKAGIELDEEDEEESEKGKSKGKKKKKLTKEEKKKLALKMAEQSAHQYMQNYPSFHENTAYMLFEIDFKELRPEVESLAFFTEWTTLSAFICEQIRMTDVKFLEDTTLTPAEKNLHLLRSIGKLFPIVSIPGSRKTTDERGKKVTRVWRPSHVEVADAFVLITSSALSFEEEKDARRTELRKLRMHMQPFVAVIGDVENPSQYLICVDEFFYEVDSPLQAVDLAFKSFFALNMRYPAEAEQVWLFLQRAVYGFTTEEDSSFVGVDLRVKEYEKFKKKKQVK